MNFYLVILLTLFVFVNFWFVVSLVRKRNDGADIAWGLGFVLLTWVALFLGDTTGERQVLVTALVTLWGLRLAWHIFRRNKNREEDYRYKAWREEWGRWFIVRSYFQVYILQGVLLFLVMLPVLYIQKESYTALGLLDLLGVLIWGIGFYFEARGDAELRRFIRSDENKGKILQTGLWAYSRHPNYFGEVVMWWGVWIIALSVSGSFWTIIGPLTITVLILFVSGIPMLEKHYTGNQEFEDYKKRTSVFFPLPPKNNE